MIFNWLAIDGFVGVLSGLVCFVYFLTHRNDIRILVGFSGLAVLYFSSIWLGGALGWIPIELRGQLGGPVGWFVLAIPALFALAHWGMEHK